MESYIKADDWIPVFTEFLKEGKKVKIKPHGFSMWPLLRSDRDEVVLEEPRHELKRGDICLYRRSNSVHVLHRIHHINKQNGTYYMIGDNQMKIEGPLKREQIIAIAAFIERDGKTISCKSLWYRIYSGLWLQLRMFRGAFTHGWRIFRRITVHK